MMVREIADLVKVAGQSVDRSTMNGLKVASAKSGVSFQYLVAKAAQESSLKTNAQAETSSAAGLFQFTRSTWLDMLKRFGPQYGYGDLAQKILLSGDGKPVVQDRTTEQHILALRENPEVSALMAAEYARGNGASLQEALGRDVDAPDLYLAHFLGPSGATALLTAAADTPTRPAASLMPAAAKANASVFYTPEGRPRTAAEVVALIRERFSGQMDRYADVASDMAGQELLGAGLPERPVQSPAGTAGRPFDFNATTSRRDPTQMMMSWFIMEELAKLISSKPMTMIDGGDDQEHDPSQENGISASGFQGTDWTAAMTKAFTKDGLPSGDRAPLERDRGTAGKASDAYGAVHGHMGVLLNRPRRDDIT